MTLTDPSTRACRHRWHVKIVTAGWVEIMVVRKKPQSVEIRIQTPHVIDQIERRQDADQIALNAGSDILSRMSIEELRRELSKTLSLTASHLVHIADVWQELIRRGEDLSDLRSGLWQYMPLIANGQLHSELVVRYAGNARLLRSLAALPRYEQDLISRNDTVLVVDDVKSGRPPQSIKIDQLSAKQIRQVFKRKILTKEEQEIFIAQQANTPQRIRSQQIGKKVVREAIQRSRKADDSLKKKISVNLSSREWQKLDSQARAASVSISSLIESALRISGLIT